MTIENPPSMVDVPIKTSSYRYSYPTKPHFLVDFIENPPQSILLQGYWATSPVSCWRSPGQRELPRGESCPIFFLRLRSSVQKSMHISYNIYLYVLYIHIMIYPYTYHDTSVFWGVIVLSRRHERSRPLFTSFQTQFWQLPEGKVTIRCGIPRLFSRDNALHMVVHWFSTSTLV